MAKKKTQDLRNGIVALQNDGLCYKRSATPWNWATPSWLESLGGFPKRVHCQNRHWQDQSKKLGPHTRCQMQKLASKNKCMSAASIAAEVAEVGGQTDRAKIIWDIVQQLGLHGRPSRWKPLLKLDHKKARKPFAEDMQSKRMNSWNYIMRSDEI